MRRNYRSEEASAVQVLAQKKAGVVNELSIRHSAGRVGTHTHVSMLTVTKLKNRQRG